MYLEFGHTTVVTLKITFQWLNGNPVLKYFISSDQILKQYYIKTIDFALDLWLTFYLQYLVNLDSPIFYIVIFSDYFGSWGEGCNLWPKHYATWNEITKYLRTCLNLWYTRYRTISGLRHCSSSQLELCICRTRMALNVTKPILI